VDFNQARGRFECLRLACNELRCHAEHAWQPDPDSEQRRLALLPHSAPLTWDELMHQPAYQRALERLP